MNSFLNEINTDSRVRATLAPGTYGTSKRPGLKIVSYIEGDKGSRYSDKDKELFMHSFLVAPPDLSREAQEEAKKAPSPSNPLDVNDAPEGTAFFRLNLKQWWLQAPVLAIAFSTKETDMAQVAVQRGEITQVDVDTVKAFLANTAAQKCQQANTPPEEMEAAVAKAQENILTQVRINVGTLLRLQDWRGVERNPQMHPRELVGVEFSGRVEASGLANSTTTEVTSVYSRKQPKAAGNGR